MATGCKYGAPSVVNSDTYAKIAAEVVSRGDVTRVGQQQVIETGQLHEHVDVLKGPRISRNSTERLTNGTYRLPYGIAWSVADALDSTASFSPWFKESFLQMGLLNGMLQGINPIYNIQSSGLLVQDHDDDVIVNGRRLSRKVALFQTQYEASAEKLAEWFQHLLGSNGGGDGPEEYQLLMAWLLFGNEADCIRYGIKPTAFLTADQVGREYLDPDMAQEHLGIQVPRMSTKELGKLLVSKFNFFYLYVGNSLNDDVAKWWKNVLGQGRVVCLSDARYGAALKAAIVYVCENKNPSRSDVIEYLVNASKGSNYPVSESVAGQLFDAIVRAGVEFGTQIPVVKLPKPGDIFDHPRNPWPIGHELYVPYQELGLPDLELGIATPFTAVIDAKPAYVIDEKTKKPRKVTGNGSPYGGSDVQTHTADTDDDSGDVFYEDESDDEEIDWTTL